MSTAADRQGRQGARRRRPTSTWSSATRRPTRPASSVVSADPDPARRAGQGGSRHHRLTCVRARGAGTRSGGCRPLACGSAAGTLGERGPARSSRRSSRCVTATQVRAMMGLMTTVPEVAPTPEVLESEFSLMTAVTRLDFLSRRDNVVIDQPNDSAATTTTTGCGSRTSPPPWTSTRRSSCWPSARSSPARPTSTASSASGRRCAAAPAGTDIARALSTSPRSAWERHTTWLNQQAAARRAGDADALERRRAGAGPPAGRPAPRLDLARHGARPASSPAAPGTSSGRRPRRAGSTRPATATPMMLWPEAGRSPSVGTAGATPTPSADTQATGRSGGRLPEAVQEARPAPGAGRATAPRSW